MHIMKNKTVAVWLTLLLGSLGVQRLYLVGRLDRWAWLTLAPSLVGWYGVVRARTLGLDDLWSWVLIPFGGFALAATALVAIRYGLMDAASWNARFNPQCDAQDGAGQTHGLTVLGLGGALMMGATVLMATIAFSFQRYFEFTA